MPYETPAINPDRYIVLFDGQCGLCHGAARLIARFDNHARFMLVAGQTPAGQQLAATLPSGLLSQTVVLLADGAILTRSTAILHICRRLAWPWPMLYALILLPRRLRDAAYDWVARRRSRWFGQADICPWP